jgi:hypothetical protein
VETLRELEFAALRATIRERGTVRLILTWATFGLWAGLLLAALVWTSVPAAFLAPLVVLAAGFETAFALHTGVERVGRYLQVFFERNPDAPGSGGWETTAMTFGQRFPGGPDPLFSVLFVLAAVLNGVLAVGGAIVAEQIGVGLFHAVFVIRVIVAGRRAARQRAQDLERFRALMG